MDFPKNFPDVNRIEVIFGNLIEGKMTEKDLECEMEELRLEIKDNAERIDKLCNLLKQNNTKLRTLKGMTNQTPCNHRTPPKYNVEYLDDKMVIVNGIQYQRVEEQKPQTLERIITECMIAYNNTVIVELMERILDRVEVEFFPKLGSIEPPLYNDGWEDCLKELKTRLRE